MNKPEPIDKELYEKVKKEVNKLYEKNSAYRSGIYIKRYKEEFLNKYGPNKDPFSGSKSKGKLTQWFKEKWEDIGNAEYPVYRPTKRVNKSTPLTVSEIDKKDLKKKIVLKQKIKGKSNLQPFLKNI